MRRLILGVIVAVFLSAFAIAQENKTPSTPEERARIVKLAADLKADPLNPSLTREREWAITRLIEVPDIHITLCSATMPWEKNYGDGGNLMAVELVTMGAYAIEHPENKDDAAAGIAGLNAALDAYQRILERDPKSRSKKMDQMLAKRTNGTMEEGVRAEWSKFCK
jgi:hypothetical protein